MMPVLDETNVVTLGEGFTPIIKAQTLGCRLGCTDLFIKDEGINPTASFKARGLSVAVSLAAMLFFPRWSHGKMSTPKKPTQSFLTLNLMDLYLELIFQ